MTAYIVLETLSTTICRAVSLARISGSEDENLSIVIGANLVPSILLSTDFDQDHTTMFGIPVYVSIHVSMEDQIAVMDKTRQAVYMDKRRPWDQY